LSLDRRVNALAYQAIADWSRFRALMLWAWATRF